MEAYCSYETFGVRFFEHAVTPERIRAALSGVVGNEIEFGPKALGPAGMARVAARGRVGEVTVTRYAERPLTFRLLIPVSLGLTVKVAGQSNRYRAELRAGLTLRVRAAEPLRVIIDIEPPTAEDVEAAVSAEGLRASMLRSAVDIDGELRRFVAGYIAREIDKKHIRRVREINVAAHLDRAWKG